MRFVKGIRSRGWDVGNAATFEESVRNEQDNYANLRHHISHVQAYGYLGEVD